MRIGIEMRLVTLGVAGGISQLLRGVLRRLFVLHPEHDYTIFCTLFNRSLCGEVPENVDALTLPTHSYMADVDRIAKERDLDVLFRGYPVEPKLAFPLNRQIFLIPDIQHEYFPEFFDEITLRSRKRAFTMALRGAGAVGTISHFALQTLRDQECTRCQDLFLMSPALQEDYRQATDEDVTPAERGLIPEEDFFIFPANLWPHKNHKRVLAAFEHFLKATGKPTSLVLTGHASGWEALRAEHPTPPIKHLGFVRPALLRALYKRARALVFFSLYEGFGMPLLEAFEAGTPVLCSNTTSLPEIGQDATLMCDPTDVHTMSRLMVRIDRDEALRQTLIRRGKEQLKHHTWEVAAENLHAACGRVAKTACPPLRICLHTIDAPLVSIVTPSYNQGQFIRRTIDSVLNQTYPNIEFCVMDGGSTDETVAILKSYGDRFHWVSEPDRGQTHAINKGFARSRGEIQAYLNSDDVLLPDAVEKAVAHFLSHNDCDLLYGRAQYINEHDEFIGMYNTDEYSFDRLMQDCCICQPAAFWRTAMAKEVGPFNEDLQYAMDYDYWIRIDRAGGGIEHIHDMLASSRLYAATKTLSARREIYQEIFEVCRSRAGFTHVQFFHGYWHHLCHERDSGWPRRLRWLPKFMETMAYLHHKWWNRHRYDKQRFLAKYHELIGSRLSKYLRVPGPIKRLMQRTAVEPPPRPVNGYWSDNWLAPTCTVALREALPGKLMHLSGVAPTNSTLNVRFEGEDVASYDVQAHVPIKIKFHLPQKPGKQLSLEFSQHIVDSAARPLAFLLQDTNLFAEQDVA